MRPPFSRPRGSRVVVPGGQSSRSPIRRRLASLAASLLEHEHRRPTRLQHDDLLAALRALLFEDLEHLRLDGERLAADLDRHVAVRF